MTLDTASGTLVPAAKKVKPITESGMLMVSPREKKIMIVNLLLIGNKNEFT